MNDPLIAAALHPLSGDAESRFSARMLLETLREEHADQAHDALKRWEAHDGKKRRPIWRVGLYCVLAIVSAVILADGVNVLRNYENMISTMGSSYFVDFFHNSPKITDEEVARNLTDDQKLLLFGDLTKSSKAERIKVLWDSEPENPAYFARYLDAYLEEFKKLPPDFLETARRIDPENAWFTYVAAGVRAEAAVKRREQSKAEKAANAPLEWDVLDAAALSDALALLMDARDQPKCETYQSTLGREQMKMLPTDTPAEVTFALSYLYGISRNAKFRLYDLASALAAKAWLCGEENDSAAFRNLLINADGFLRKLSNAEVESLTGELINTAAAFTFVSNASPAARKLGFHDDSERLDASLEIINRRKARFSARKPDVNSDLLYRHGGNLAAMISIVPSRKLEAPPLLTMRDLEPGRLMDHETLAWTSTYFMWALLMLGMGLAAGFRFRSPILVRRLAARMECLIPARDWILILGFGIVLPIVFFLVVTRFTSWGGRGLSMEYNNLEMPYFDDPPLGLAQHVGLALLMVFGCGTASCWCLWKRAKPFRLVKAGSASALIPTACVAAFIPVSGWSVVHSSDSAGIAAWVLAGIAASWLLVIFTKVLLGQYRTQLHYGIIARMLVPCCVFAALLSLSAAPFCKAMAYHWSGKDMLVRMDKNHPLGSEFEHRVAVQLRKELREALGYER